MNSSSITSSAGPAYAASEVLGTCATPFYYSAAPSLMGGLSDPSLSLAAPIVAYWGLSLFFHFLDTVGWRWLERHRIHDSAEVAARNKASRADVLGAVIFQQVLQTAMGWWWIEDHAPVPLAAHCAHVATWAPPVARALAPALGAKAAWAGAEVGAYWIYWWAIPVLQFVWAMFVIDTWQYFLHRAMHLNKFLYRHLHSVHHRLYVPYAFGALYNHPIEGFVLDTIGAVLAETTAQMSVRQAALLFFVSSLKTVDDHCGYKLPWDPLQWFSENGADYHDIHHQVIGIKSNFSQPFFVHWDILLGTRLTRADIQARRANRTKAE